MSHYFENSYDIKKVALYLRKSREDDDVEDTLSKHKTQMIPFVESKGWAFDMYEEIGSGDRISERPVFSELLEIVKAGNYDAIVSVEVARLTRGSQKDAGLIEETFEHSDTLIITPMEIIDLATEPGKQRFEMLTWMSRNEYRMIKTRLKNGKINGTKQGEWTNGKPMFPYVYDRNAGNIVVSSEENTKIYLYIVDLFLNEELGTDAIASRLNRESIPTIRGRGKWQQSQILRLLNSGVHAGFVYYGKRRRTHDNRVLQNDDSKIIFVKGSHESIISEEQYNEIIRKINERRKIPVAARNSTFVFSGLLKCANCGRALKMTTKIKEPSKRYPERTEKIYVKHCENLTDDGFTKCKNSGIPENILLIAVEQKLDDQYHTELSSPPTHKPNEKKDKLDVISIQEDTVDKSKSRLSRLQDLYLDGDINKVKYNEQKAIEEDKILKAQHQIKLLRQSKEYLNYDEEEERYKRWSENFVKNMLTSRDFSAKEKNQYLRKLIDKIVYKRQGDDIAIDVFVK